MVINRLALFYCLNSYLEMKTYRFAVIRLFMSPGEQNFKTRCSVRHFFHSEKIDCLSIVMPGPFLMAASDCAGGDEVSDNGFV